MRQLFYLSSFFLLSNNVVDAHPIGRRGEQQQRMLTGRRHPKIMSRHMHSYFPCLDQGSDYHDVNCPPTPHSSSRPTEVATPPASEPSTNLPQLELNPNQSTPFGSCTGPCQGDGDCFGDLECYDTVAVNTRQLPQIPGCSGTPQSDQNYCYNPFHGTNQLVDSGNNGSPSNSYPLALCQGDCDNDDECGPGLKCYQRGASEAVPGCSDDNNAGKSGNDYCILEDSSPIAPTRSPTRQPTQTPTDGIVETHTKEPTPAPTDNDNDLSEITYHPGEFSANHRSDDGLIRLSNGLAGELIAVSGEFVSLAGSLSSSQEFHIAPDGAAVFENPETGGWYYVSNAENKTKGTEWLNGGVGSIEFDASGQAIGYERVANRLRMNCGGGKTPWNSWVTCEEIDGGRVYQVDPKGVKEKNRTDMGSFGAYESFAYDIYTDPDTPRFFVTRDAHNGVITRFTPNEQGMECYRKSNDYDRWCTLNYGTRDYLLISGGPSGTFVWTTDLNAAKENAELYYKHTEGIDSYQGYLYFTSKKEYRLVILNLEDQTYTYESTKSGSFNAQPDQVARILNGNDDWEDDHDEENKILYFCEDGGRRQDGPGIFGRDAEGKYFTILYSDGIPYQSETTGLAYSPSGHDMYVSFQEAGRIYRFYRRDGHPFQGSMLDIKYHTT